MITQTQALIKFYLCSFSFCSNFQPQLLSAEGGKTLEDAL